MMDSKLKLNPDKTEFIVFGTPHQQKQLSEFFPMDIFGNNVVPSDVVRNLGVFLDSKLSFSKHISHIRKSCYPLLRDLARIRRSLSKTIAIRLANALVSSRLDYCNSLFYGCNGSELKRLQGVQNSLCRVVCNLPRYSSTSQHLRELHWLPIEYRIQFKCCCLIYKYLNTGLPPYFSNSLISYVCSANTRRSSPSKNFLFVPAFISSLHKSKKFYQNSFSVFGPQLWNSLPQSVRTASTLLRFRRELKTHLFKLAYPP